MTMQLPGVHVETLRPPTTYSPAQIDRAIAIALLLGRGLFVLTQPPEGKP